METNQHHLSRGGRDKHKYLKTLSSKHGRKNAKEKDVVALMHQPTNLALPSSSLSPSHLYGSLQAPFLPPTKPPTSYFPQLQIHVTLISFSIPLFYPLTQDNARLLQYTPPYHSSTLPLSHFFLQSWYFFRSCQL
ncbi:Hypothetical predicted protein [Octopus vulgaris]|uniref:Uncharacterized protein n=1 Tax=Octopus vulgaris TaxID=6645 RepID=A0AA36EXG0_OCTVU|nr:Hypothetical predicted protein [Octopus vulgaris]